MRFTTIETMCDPSFMLPLARAAEEAGYDGFAVPDSICYPQESDTRYPYNADGSREFLDDKPILEPFSLIPAMAAVTTRLRFSTLHKLEYFPFVVGQFCHELVKRGPLLK